MIQLLFTILRTISHNFQFNSSTEGSLSKYTIETAHGVSNSTDVDALKFRQVQYDTFYGGQIQQDNSQCFAILIEVVNKDSAPYFDSNDTDNNNDNDNNNNTNNNNMIIMIIITTII